VFEILDVVDTVFPMGVVDAAAEMSCCRLYGDILIIPGQLLPAVFLMMINIKKGRNGCQLFSFKITPGREPSIFHSVAEKAGHHSERLYRYNGKRVVITETGCIYNYKNMQA